MIESFGMIVGKVGKSSHIVKGCVSTDNNMENLLTEIRDTTKKCASPTCNNFHEPSYIWCSMCINIHIASRIHKDEFDEDKLLNN